MRKIMSLMIGMFALVGCSSPSSTTDVSNTPTPDGGKSNNDTSANGGGFFPFTPIVDAGTDSHIVDSGMVKMNDNTMSPPDASDNVPDASQATLTCPSGYTSCGANYCMPNGSICCTPSTGLYCANGGSCQANGTCGGSCAVSNSLSCTIGSLYSCTGAEVPTNTNTNLICGTGNVIVGSTDYCCREKCIAPSGTYITVYTTLSGNCGNIGNSIGVLSNLIYDAEQLQIAPTNCTDNINGVCPHTQGASVLNVDNCGVSSSETISGIPWTGSDTISISSNADGSVLNGTLTFSDDYNYVPACSGTYSFVSVRQ